MNDVNTGGQSAPSGSLGFQRTTDLGMLSERRPAPLAWKVKNFLQNGYRGVPSLIASRFLGKVFGVLYVESCLRLKVFHADGTFTDYGVVGRRVVTTAGANALSGGLQGTFTLSNLKFHGFGTGSTAEAIGDVALVTELTTQYAVDNTRPTGSQAAGGSANIYRTIATLSPDATVTIAEHGIFSATSAGTLFDRTVFTGVPLTASADSLQATYDVTFPAGG